MAKVKELSTLTVSDKPENKSKTDDRISLYQAEFQRWLDVLSKIHTDRFDVNYRQYTSYADTRGTESKISDPMAPELVERVIQKLFERQPKFYAHGYGTNLPKPVTQIIASTAEHLWNNPKVIQSTGTMRAKLKVAAREFCVTGNVGVETFYNEDANAPDLRVLPIEDVIFDPTKSLKRSPVYYIRQYVSWDYLWDNRERTEKDELGRKVHTGIFRNLEPIRAKYEEVKPSLQNNPDSNRINRSGTTGREDTVDDILLISRWEGRKCCRIVDWEQIVQEYDNDILNEDPLDFAMDIEVPKQPYGFSLLDFINGLTHAKDLVLNQVVDYGSKALNPPLFVDPTLAAVNRASLRNAFRLGGIVFAQPNQVAHLPMPSLPTAAFDMLAYMQQRAESASGIGAYLGGVPNQTSDKTQGTKGGIEALISQAVSPVRDRQLALEEAIVEPVVNKFLKYAAKLMGENELRHVLLTGQQPKWVAVTKGLLDGQITLNDLAAAELMTPEEIYPLMTQMMTQGIDPNTTPIFTADWLVRVEAGSMAEVNKEEQITNMERAVAFGMQLGVQLDTQKMWVEHAIQSGLKEPEQYILQQPMLPPQPVPGDPNAEGVGRPEVIPMAQPQQPMAPGGF